jgi:2,5-furandicarboxylate decarboxylase 1
LISPLKQWRAAPDLRGWLEVRREQRRLVVVSRRVDPRFEAPALLAKLDGASTLLARDAGEGRALAGNAALTRADFALALGCAWRDVPQRLQLAAAAQRRTAPASDAPVLAQRSEAPLAEALVVCTHHERDAGPYLTSGVVMLEDPLGGRASWSINRMQLAGERRLLALVQQGGARAALERIWAQGGDAPVAIAVGVDPLALLATQVRAAEPLDGLAVYGALCGRPVATVRAPFSTIEVPARAEWLLEGRILRERRLREGPFGEFPRTYGAAQEGGLVVEVEAIWHRDRPISQTILPAGREHLLLGGLAREAAILRRLRVDGLPVTAVRLTEGGSCRLHAAVSCAAPGAPAAAVVASLFAADPLVKHVVVVDDDVDVHDNEQLEWAIATRVRAHRDLIVLEDQPGTQLDPAAEAGRVTKLALDATVGAAGGPRHRRISIPGFDTLDLAAYVDGP